MLANQATLDPVDVKPSSDILILIPFTAGSVLLTVSLLFLIDVT
jgi:hypothetical protein